MSNACLRECGMTHEMVGAEGAPIVVALGGISATRHVARLSADERDGWWGAIVGPGRAIDTRACRVLGVDYIDSAGESGETATTHHQADALAALLDDLDVPTVDAIVGASYGGMVALAFGEHHAGRVGSLVVISAAHETTPAATAVRSVQRRIVELGLEFGHAREAMACARALAMTTYRTATEFNERFSNTPCRQDGSVHFEVECYLRNAGERFADTMSPERFLALSLSIDLHRVTPEDIHVPVTLVRAEGDALVPAAQMAELARRLPKLRAVEEIRTRTGHDAFLTEPAQLGAILSRTLPH